MTIDKRFGPEKEYFEAKKKIDDLEKTNSDQIRIVIADYGGPVDPKWCSWFICWDKQPIVVEYGLKTYVEAANAVIAHFKEKGWAR